MSYRSSAQFYDLFFDKPDIEFYRDWAVKLQGTVLEIGIGTARLAIPIARAGVHVVGIDNLCGLLRVAQAKLNTESS
jgi:2-polyprenyl-3-methyl-5-hydroxy-6-metoxy-1,4-benzoquinol methylase